LATLSVAPAFSVLDPRLQAYLEQQGITSPTEIQRISVDLLLASDDDALLVAPTGTGKTEAALLPLLSRRLRNPSPPTVLLYVTPLRALNRDLEQRLIALVEAAGLTAGVRHGDTPPRERLRQSGHPRDLLITTPETLQLLLVGTRLRESLRSLKAVIVDEVHELFPSDRGAQLAVTLERLDAFVGRPVRRVGLSATVGNPDQVARFLSPAPRRVDTRIAREPRDLQIEVRWPTAAPQRGDPALEAELRADARYLAALREVERAVRAHRTTLIFVNTRPTAEGLAARLHRLAPDLPLAVHHGSLSREVREEAEKEFRAGHLRALIATSSLELGIDVGAVDLVLQFGSPRQATRLLQRVGRAGHRLDRTSNGIVVALDDEDLEEAAVLARRALKGEVEPTTWRTRNRLAAAQQILGTLRAEGTVDPKEVAHRLRHAAALHGLTDSDWRELANYLESLGLVRHAGGRLRSGRGTLDRFYSTLSLIPEERTYRLRDIGTRKVIGTLDERFVMTQVIGQPDLVFLLHGTPWRVVEFRDGELLVEAAAEFGQEPRWVGEELPVPFEAAQEVGRLRREGDYSGYPVTPEARTRLEDRLRGGSPSPHIATDRKVVVQTHGRLVTVGACFGSRTNTTLSLVMSGLLAARLGARVEVLDVEPTWFVLGLPVALDLEALRQSLSIPPDHLETLLDRLVPASLEYRWVFITVARKLGVLPASADVRDLRIVDSLIEQSRSTPLGEEALEKTLHDRHDLDHAREVLERIRAQSLEVVTAPADRWSDRILETLRWQFLPDVPPPTLLKAIRDRLQDEELTLVCLRCGFTRTTTPTRSATDGSRSCRLCHGTLSAVLSPRRAEEIAAISKYAREKRKGVLKRKGPSAGLTARLRAAYTSAELLATYGEKALLALAARGIGPDTARRLLARHYRDENALLAEILRAERSYARTRAFWD
jgi:ATP-dependent helicase Lhr and Lhr-like helicase